jgi:eukaryotic-like serine/threonine-protein kinase
MCALVVPSRRVMTPTEGALLGGKYRLRAPLARGGMGLVWTAVHTELDVQVAVKFVDPALSGDERTLRRFRREARAAARLKSPHVARIFDFGEQDDLPYIAMELLEGEDLAALLRREHRVPKALLARMVSELAKGLGEAHDAGIVHRDLKPSNVFLARVAGERIVKVLDFGIAKQFSGDAVDDGTTTGSFVGSPRYMSPEQVRSLEVDARADLWSVGVLLFEALTGQRLFAAKHVGDIIAAVSADPIPRASAVAPELGDAFDAFFARALERDPARRFSSVHELSTAFDAACAADPGPVTAAPRPLEAAAEALARTDATGDLAPAAHDELPTVIDPVSHREAPSAAPAGASRRRSRAPWIALGAVALGAALWAGMAIGAKHATPPAAGRVVEQAPAQATQVEAPRVEALTMGPQAAPNPGSHEAPPETPTADVASAAPSVAPSTPRRQGTARRPPAPPAATAKSDRDDFFGVRVSKKKP